MITTQGGKDNVGGIGKDTIIKAKGTPVRGEVPEKDMQRFREMKRLAFGGRVAGSGGAAGASTSVERGDCCIA